MKQNLIGFRPAEYHHGKEACVVYYVQDPGSGKMVRKRVKINRVHGARERARYALHLCHEINVRLFEGWNPFIDGSEFYSGITVKQGIDEFLKSRRGQVRPDTMRSYRSYLKWAEQQMSAQGKLLLPVRAFTAADAENMASALSHRPHTATRTYNSYLHFLKNLFNFFISKTWLKENPFARIPVKKAEAKRRTTIPIEVRTQIAGYFMEHGLTPYLYVMQLCYKCLVRPKEILMLQIRHIDYAEKLLNIPAEIAKNHKPRTIAIPPEIMGYLDLVAHHRPEEYIFSEHYLPGHEMKDSRYTARTWAKMRSDLKLPPCYQFYSLKDTGITELLESGVPAKYVKELADHHSLSVTERYMHRTSAKIILSHNNLRLYNFL